MFGGIRRFQLVHVAMSSETFEMVEMFSTPAMVDTCSEHSIRDVDLFDTWPPKISSCLAQQIYSELSFEQKHIVWNVMPRFHMVENKKEL